MSKSFKTFLKHAGKDLYNQSVNPPVVRASTIIFKSLEDIRKAQNKGIKNPTDGNFSYGREGTSTTFALQQMLRKIEESYEVFLTPTGFGAVFLAIFSVVRPGDEILLSDPIYSPTRLLSEDYLKEFNIQAVFYDPNNINDLKNKISKKMYRTTSVGIRLNPNITGKTHKKISTGGRLDKFGLKVLAKMPFTLPKINKKFWGSGCGN